MPGEGRTPPKQFPCLCRAIYSWGGEKKGDLGFVEGELIECLNAGDGQWWVGRLKRNRMVGEFPSNFVEVLEEPVPPPRRPVSRAGATSAMSYAGGGSLTRSHSPAPPRSHSPAPPRSHSPAPPRSHSPAPPRSHSPAPPRQTKNGSPNVRDRGYDYDDGYGRASSSHRRHRESPEPPYHHRPRSRVADIGPAYHDRPPSRAGSPGPPVHYQQARPVSPAPPVHYQLSRTVSPIPPVHYQPTAVSPAPSHYPSRPVSPAPSHYQPQTRSTSPIPPNYHPQAVSPAPPLHYSRGPSPEPPMMYDDGSSPPAPPPHRSGRVSPMPVPQPQHLTPGHSRAPTPSHGTPSPLRSAMADVMSSLQHMVSHDNDYSIDHPTTHNDDDPWSPNAFRDLYSQTPTRPSRPHTSLGMGMMHDLDDHDEDHDPYESNGFSGYPGQRPVSGMYGDRMEDRIRRFQSPVHSSSDHVPDDDRPPPPPPKRFTVDELQKRFSPEEIAGIRRPQTANFIAEKRKSAFELGSGTRGNTRSPLSRFTTVKSIATSASSSSNAQSVVTNSTTSTGMTSLSLMSGISAGGFSATSAGSLARRKVRAMSVVDGSHLKHQFGARPETPMSGTGSGSGSGSGTGAGRAAANLLRKSWRGPPPQLDADSPLFGGHAVPKPKKTGFLKKLLNGAKATTASAKSFTYAAALPPAQPIVNRGPGDVITSIQNAPSPVPHSQDWVQVRRDVNRSNSLSRIEREERQQRAQMLGHLVLRPVDALDEDVEGDESASGGIVREPVDFPSAPNIALVDKTARFVNNLPVFTSPETLATMHICRPYRSDVQKLRAIYVWVSEKIAWERPATPIADNIEPSERERMEIRRVMQSKRGSPEQVANVVLHMCQAVGIEAQVVNGYLKAPGEPLDTIMLPRPNHFWNAVVCDGEWRMMDCSLSSPTHPRRAMYSSAPTTTTDFHWFLTPPSKFCWTHVPTQPQHQHMVPPLPIENLLALPVVTSVFFQNNLQMINFDTSLLRIEGLEVAQIDFVAPLDIECIAEVEARGFTIDAQGDLLESGEVIKKRALAQVSWENGVKTYRVKALVPGENGQSVLKVYAGRRGLMHSIKDNPHPLALAVPLVHTGENPQYEFIPRHPTPHATRHDLYISQPQCYQLALNNTFVFTVRQHLSSGFNSATEKPAKLALQSPSGKITRLVKKGDTMGCESGILWETIVKCTERGAWRALVLADRSHRWCVYGEWLVN